MLLQQSFGIIKYNEGKVYLDIDKDFARYYFSLIPKYYYAKRPLYDPHITIVRSGIEVIKKNYRQWDGLRIPFVYLPIIQHDRIDYHGKPCNLYFWIDCFSLHIGLLRQDLGLTFFRQGFHSYHLTIGNLKTNDNKK